MAGLFKHFQLQPLLKETGLGESLMKEVNAAMERVLEEEQIGAEGQYSHFTTEQTAKERQIHS